MTNNSSPEKSSWGWKAVIIVCILGALFMGIFYLAVSNEPDYMPSQKRNQTHTTHQQQSSASEPTAAEMNMTEQEHANMAEHDASAAHGH
ncbi:DUF4199 domain-containing protein [Acinetobacter sp. A1-4-2]|uniref:DUF4199 domain-containing protein n=1 Tax=Acinetobacter sp. A1-4-2 TaxID=3156489 RepID=A0AAU7SW10_9GAMM|nr:DUF4199 domain-containing protein [Acinetobacter sp. ANC 4218]OTG72931.1 hypothetical protein B9T38_04715 [Acinetobacter sp. ANC 4218]